VLVISVAGHPGQGPDVSFELNHGADGVYRLWIHDHCPWAPGRISVAMTDEQRKALIRVLGGIPAGFVDYEKALADAPARAV